MQLWSTCNPVGHEYGNKSQDNNFPDSVVFVHGLTGGLEKTWTHEDGTFWPRDLLAKDFPKARILTVGYDADVTHVFAQASTNTLRDHGKALCTDVAMLRSRTSSVS
jgi:hypothetical protein